MTIKPFVPWIATIILSFLHLSCMYCKCTDGRYGLIFALPLDGSIGAPTNTRIWLPSCWRPRAIMDETGLERVFFDTCIQTPLGEVGVLRFSEDLLPNTRYSVIDWDDTANYHFTTGAGPSIEPPPLPEVDDLDITHVRDCGDRHHLATYSLSGAGAIYLANAGETPDLDLTQFTGAVTAIEAAPGAITIGQHPCTGADNFPGGVSRVSSTTLRFGALDLAGNFSGWTEPEELTFAGCSVGKPPAHLAWFLVPLLLSRPRRRRPKEPVVRVPDSMLLADAANQDA